MNSINKISHKHEDMIISLSYLIVSLHQKLIQNHKKSINFDMFRIQKHVHAGYVNEQHPGPVHELLLCSFYMLDYFQNAKMMIFDVFFWFFLVFVIFPQKNNDFFRFTTLKYAPMLLFSWFYATMVFRYCTNLPIISADRIERPKNRTECDFGVLSDPHLLWDGVVTTPT